MNTPAQFRRAAAAQFRRANPDAGAELTWTRTNRCTYADGSAGFAGTFTAVADNYRTSTVTASWSPTCGLSTR